MPELGMNAELLTIETIILLPVLGLLLISQLARAKMGVGFHNRSNTYFLMSLGSFAVISGFFISQLWNLSPLLCFELAASIVLALMNPMNALCLFVAFLMLRPWELIQGYPILLVLPRAFAALWLIARIAEALRLRQFSLKFNRETWLLLAYGTWVFISTFWTPSPADTQAEWFDNFSRAIMLFMMCVLTIRRKSDVRDLKSTIVLGVLGMAIIGFYQFLSTPASLHVDDRLRSIGLLEDPNDFAAITVLALPLAAAPFFRRQSGMFLKFIGAIFSLLSFAAVWYSRSRGALLAFIMTIGVRFVIGMKNNRVVAVVAITILYLSYTALLTTFDRNAEDMETSSSARITYWKAGAKMTMKNPLLGVGFMQYPYQYENYSPTLEFEWGLRTAHSSWVLAFAETGLTGGILFTLLFFSTAQVAWRAREEEPELFYSLVGYGTAMFFLSHTYLIYPYLLFGLISAQGSIQRNALKPV